MPLRVCKLPLKGKRGQRQQAIARFRTGSLSCLCLKIERATTENQQPCVEIAVVAPKKQVSKLAVKRNLAKRRLRSALREINFTELMEFFQTHKLSTAQCLVICHQDILKVQFTNLVADLNKCLRRAIANSIPQTNTNAEARNEA